MFGLVLFHHPVWQLTWRSFYSAIPFGVDLTSFVEQAPYRDRLCRSGFQLASLCSVCGVSNESADHIFLQCPITTALYEAVFSAFQRRVSTDSWNFFFLQAMSVSFSDQPPASGWIKVNTYGAALSSLGVGGCEGVFRNCRAFCEGLFCYPSWVGVGFEAELLEASLAISFAALFSL
ncbi:hypothetical protein Dsin_012523 [Dipteronia sinensis]|uniref:Reverse transcriptase zinc-binding domain-containing protein n=1 Tax=Dipteronia sinensis TaxID=43782 RepID=A0AAE0AIQ8_9ROSI|nr:hypothetical protein Dsin_012523 [Dipteronia sinensis]